MRNTNSADNEPALDFGATERSILVLLRGDDLREGGPLTDAQIAGELSLPQEAVKAHLVGLYDKLHLPRLTEAERRVVIVLCRPLRAEDGPTPATNRQVANAVFLAEDTVKAHLRTLYEKFGLGEFPQNEKRARLAERILQSGLLSTPAPSMAKAVEADAPASPPSRWVSDDRGGRGGADVSEPAPRMQRRRWAATTIGVIILAGLLAGAAGYLVFSRDSPSKPPIDRQSAAAELAARRFDSRLVGVFGRLDTTRRSRRRQMADAKSVRGQAAAARAIASAYRAAVASIDGLTPADDQRGAAAVVTDKLARASRVYDQLAAAASARDRRWFNDRRSAIGGREAAVRRAVARVSAQ
jgi:DNA-binding CsgD family transcriptional regulator